MSFLLAGAAAVTVGGGIAKAISGGKQKRKAQAEADRAKTEMKKQKKKLAAMDTSNPYANMQNTMEDLTVNQQEADFVKQQQQENQANIMQQMKGSAGASGIAALAQTLANQGSMDAQKAAISIGKQESANQMAAAQQEGQLQQMEAAGDRETQRMNMDRQSTMLGMAQSELAARKQAVQAADQKMWSGISGAVGGVTNLLTGGLGGGAKEAVGAVTSAAS